MEKRAGHQAYAGTINSAGALTVRATKLAEESTLSKITQMVAELEDAGKTVMLVAARDSEPQTDEATVCH